MYAFSFSLEIFRNFFQKKTCHLVLNVPTHPQTFPFLDLKPLTDIPIQNIDIKQTVLNFISFFKELVSKKQYKLCTQLLRNSFKAPKQLKIAKANSNSLLTLQASTPQNGQTHLRMVLYSPVKALVIESNFALNSCHANIPFVSLRKILKTRNFVMFSGGRKVNLVALKNY